HRADAGRHGEMHVLHTADRAGEDRAESESGSFGGCDCAGGHLYDGLRAGVSAGAIVFGNIKDPNSRVSQLKKQDRGYSLLEFLPTKPRLTYLARVRNPNTAMPDYQESPLTLQEHEKKMKHTGDPFEHEAPAHEASAHGESKGGHE